MIDIKTSERRCGQCGELIGGVLCDKTECKIKYMQAHVRDRPVPAVATAGVPKRYQRAEMDDFDATDSLAIFGARNPGKTGPINRDGLFITGGPGAGKTHLAAALLKVNLPALVRVREAERHEVFVSALWGTVPEFLAELRSTFGDHGTGTELAVIARYAAPMLLVLDDLGAEKASDWTAQSLYLLLSRRLNDCKPTIVTSNLTLADIHAATPRLASRLGGMAEIQLAGEDRRLAERTDAGTADTTKGGG